MINWNIIHNFKKKEFICPCCGLEIMDLKFIMMIDSAREIAGIPFRINSGYRCKKHNIEIGGSEDSSHMDGLACDIMCVNSIQRGIIMRALIEVGFRRIGIADNFLHVDFDKSKVECFWLYK